MLLRRTSIAAAVTKLFVAPEARRQGVGRCLLQKALKQARAARAQVATLHADAANTAAQRLYLGTGHVGSLHSYCVGRDAHPHAMKLQLFSEGL